MYINWIVSRIKQCTEITEQELVVAHHEMGHIEYFLQYKDQPFKFREGANDGFHEAIGDLIALSVTSSKHLKRIGLLPNEPDNPKKVLNALFKVCIFCFFVENHVCITKKKKENCQ